MDTVTFMVLIGLGAAVAGWALMQILFARAGVDRRRLQERLVGNKGQQALQTYHSIIKPPEPERRTRLDRIVRKFRRRLERAYPEMSIARFVLIVLALALGAFAGATILTSSLGAGAFCALLATAVPFLMVNSRSNKVQRMIDDQLPDALDFLARVLRAGHSLSVGFQMSSEELPNPLAAEFRRCYDQHNLGQPLEDVMKEMAIRVGVPDFAFFVTAVLIQRQTGGDLAEVLRNIGSMVRSRIRLQQHVKAITAEGRLVGAILLALPFVFFFILYVLNPKYAGVLITTSEGRWVLLSAAVMQILGVVTIRKIVSVKM